MIRTDDGDSLRYVIENMIMGISGLPVEKTQIVFNCSMQNNDTLVQINDGTRLVVVISSDITGCKRILKSDRFCVCILINNKSERWYRRFGVIMNLGFGVKK